VVITPIAKGIAIAVETVGTLVEVASDVVESCQSTGTC